MPGRPVVDINRAAVRWGGYCRRSGLLDRGALNDRDAMNSITSTWRDRWANEENVRLLQAHEAAYEQWQLLDDVLRGMRDAVASFSGAPADPGVGLRLRPGERVFLTQPGVWPVV